jgi:hypothetical protein
MGTKIPRIGWESGCTDTQGVIGKKWTEIDVQGVGGKDGWDGITDTQNQGL